MLKLQKHFFIVIFIAVSFITCAAYADNFDSKNSSSTKQVRGKLPKVENEGIYYTKTNMWFEHPKNFLSINFHKGMIIPAGTKVKILRCSGAKIRFVDEDNGVTYDYVHSKKHSRIKLKELFSRYFSKENVMAPGGAFSAFTKEEQENIKEGEITMGMSKDAVLMAYGYPPSHKTLNLSSDTWTYWVSRASRVEVYFKDGVVTEIEGG